MNKNSDPNINTILDQLRKNVENRSEKSTIEEGRSHSGSDTPDQILNKLKEHMGGGELASEEPRTNDYDISGFEIDEPDIIEEPEIENQSEIPEAPETVKPNEPCEEHITFEETASCCPEEETAFVIDETLSADTTDETDSSAPQEDQPPIDLPVVEEQDEDDENELENLALQNTEENAETVRQRVEAFVEKTVTPEEEFDYFAEMERKLSKTSDSEAEPKEDAEPLYDAVVQEVEIQENLDGQNDTYDFNDNESSEIAYKGAFFQKAMDRDCQDVPQEVLAENSANLLDDTDINLLLALGQKKETEESIGFVRVREAKNNFYDPTDEEPISHRVFAYDGQEFRSPEQTESIKNRYRKDKKTLYKRLVGTLICSLFLLVSEHAGLFLAHIPFISFFVENKILYYSVNTVLLALCCLCSIKQIFNGARGFFVMRPNQHTAVTTISAIAFTYSLATLLFFSEQGLMTYGFAVSVFWILSIVGDKIRLTKETMTFDVISDEKEKFSLEKEEISAKTVREFKSLQEHNLLVERVSFVGKYFTRTARRSSAFTAYFAELLVTMSAAIFVFILVSFLKHDIAIAINAFVFVLVFCVPAQQLISDIFALGRFSKILYRHNSAIIGENVTNEYVGANTVYLDDIEVFGHHGVSVSGLRVYEKEDLCNILYYAKAVFSQVEGPLRYVFDNSSHDISDAKEIHLINIHADGIEAVVDSQNTVLIGNIAFMHNNGFFPKRNEEDDKKVEDGELALLYMALNGHLCSKFYMKYSITQRFEKFVTEMNENGTRVGIRTLDPNVTERMIHLLRKDKDTEISVIRPTLNDLVPLGRRSDSGIITAKGPHMISRILAQCSRLKKINRFNAVSRLLAIILNVLAVVIISVLGGLLKVPSILIAAIQLAWCIPTLIYTTIQLK